MTTDTTPLAPTDAEIVAFAVENGARVRTGKGAIKLVRAALTRWGQPAHSGEPGAWKHDCAALLMNDVELWIDACPHCGKPRNAPQPTQAQAGAEPLTDEQKNAMWVAATIELPSPQSCYLRGMADAERAHGIGINGGQHV